MLSRDEVLAQYGGGRRDFSGENLRNLDLSETALEGVVLRGADLRGADLRGASLVGADLLGADLDGARLEEADLARAALPGEGEWPDGVGTCHPLGCTRLEEDRAYAFALYASTASFVELLLDGDDLRTPVAEIPFHATRNRSGRVWHRRVTFEEARGARYYAYRVGGERLESTNRFDSEKVLLDPYAPAVHFPPEFSRERC